MRPGLGYYMTPRALFGAAGDFVTAPELSPLFAACLANGVADLLAKSGGGDVVEFGAGSGALAAELWPALAAARRVRRGAIASSSRAPRSPRASASASPGTGARALARPVRMARGGAARKRGGASRSRTKSSMRCRSTAFASTRAGLRSLGVVVAGDGCLPVARAARRRGARGGRRVAAACVAGADAARDSCPSCGPASAIGSRRCDGTLARGAFLVVDYGLAARAVLPRRRATAGRSADSGGIAASRTRSPTPGSQDLTAWVDFSALADDGARLPGSSSRGFATQAHYLLATGIERELARLSKPRAQRRRRALGQDAATLLLPGEMGERFKVMALARGIRAPLLGFGFRDLAASL